MEIWAIVLAAGSSTRLGTEGIKNKKQFLEYKNAPLYWQSISILAHCPAVSGITLVFPPDELKYRQGEGERLHRSNNPEIPLLFAPGGTRRQDSVFNALQELPSSCDMVLVHDAARPFFSPTLVHRLTEGLTPDTDALIPVLPCKDTIKMVNKGIVQKTLARSELFSVQTPQAFRKNALISAHFQALENGLDATDDAYLVERSGGRVKTITGEENNLKITTVEDLKKLQRTLNAPDTMQFTAFGYDVHKFGGNRPMLLGGIPVPNGPSIEAHSDGDVLLHALADAIFGLAGKGDLGDYFPDSDPENENKSSSIFLAESLHIAEKEGIILTHIDLTIITQTPRLSEFKPLIRKNIIGITGLKKKNVNIKATTEEGLGFTGSKLGIKAMAVVSARKKSNEKEYATV